MYRHRVLTVLALFGAGCGGHSATAPIATSTQAIVNAMPSIAFTPISLTIVPGGIVTFAFGTVAHNVFFQTALGTPAEISGSNANTSATRTFASAGTFTYQCHTQPGMAGTIIVSAESLLISTAV